MLLYFIWGLIVFIILIFFSLGTYCILFKKSNGSNLRASKSTFCLSLSSCFACGIFLSTCFLGLLPHVREHEKRIRIAWAKSSETESSNALISSELMVLIGFVLILVIEQAVRVCNPTSNTKHCHGIGNTVAPRDLIGVVQQPQGRKNDTHTSAALLSISGDEEPLVLNRFDVDDDDSDDEDSRLEPKIEFRRVENEQHGHATDSVGHTHMSGMLVNKNGISLNSCFLLLGLSIHSIFEGIALGIQTNLKEFYGLLLAIMLHEVLCSLAFGVNLAQQKTPAKPAALSAGFLAACIPLGMCSSVVVSSMDSDNALVCRFILEGLAAGTFVYVACVEMLSGELHVQGDIPIRGLWKAFAVCFGVIVFFLITTFHRHSHVVNVAVPTTIATTSPKS